MAFLGRDVWIGIVMGVVAVAFWLEAGRIRVSPLDDPVGAAGLPRALAVGLGTLAVLLIVRSVTEAILARRAGHTGEGGGTDAALMDHLRPHLRAIAMLGIGVVYLLLIGTLGYTITVMLLILAVSLYIGAPLGARTLIIAVGGGVLFYFLFVRFLGIPLPPGILLPALFGAAG